MENLNEEREIRIDKEMIKRKCKIEKMAENLNKEREGRTDKVVKKKKRKKKKKKERTKRDKEREIAREFLSLHPCLSQFEKE